MAFYFTEYLEVLPFMKTWCFDYIKTYIILFLSKCFINNL